MKTELLLVLNLLFLANAQQNEYTVEFDTVEILLRNKDYIQSLSIEIFKFNETSQGINATGELKKDLGSDIKLNMDVSKLDETVGQMKQITALNDVKLCDVLDKNVFGLKDMLAYGNFTTCPWKAGYYVVHNAMIDASKLPPKAAPGKYTANFHHFDGNTEFLHTKITGSVIAKSE